MYLIMNSLPYYDKTLQDRVFCDLFEDLANEIRTELAEERSRGAAEEAAMQEMNSSRRCEHLH